MGCCYSIKPLDASELTQGHKISDTIVADFRNFDATAVVDLNKNFADDLTRDCRVYDNDGEESDETPLKLPEFTSENSIASWKNPSSPIGFK
jgi:hypothetical protein